jgi:hypothetical protein
MNTFPHTHSSAPVHCCSCLGQCKRAMCLDFTPVVHHLRQCVAPTGCEDSACRQAREVRSRCTGCVHSCAFHCVSITCLPPSPRNSDAFCHRHLQLLNHYTECKHRGLQDECRLCGKLLQIKHLAQLPEVVSTDELLNGYRSANLRE